MIGLQSSLAATVRAQLVTIAAWVLCAPALAQAPPGPIPPGPISGPSAGSAGGGPPFIVRQNHAHVGGNQIPTLSACGTATLTNGSTDTAGEIIPGQTTCTLTFKSTFGSVRPPCIVTSWSMTPSYSVSATGISFTSVLAGVPVVYWCIGYLN